MHSYRVGLVAAASLPVVEIESTDIKCIDL